MTLNAAVASQSDTATVEINTEKRDTIVFFAIVALLLAAIVAAGLTFGLGGIGMIAIAGAGAMLVICLLLTAG